MKTSNLLTEFGILSVVTVALLVLAQPVISASTTDAEPTGQATPANTPPDAPVPDIAFNKVDANADGNISRGEAQKDTALSLRFQSADKNSNGYLSPQEYAEYKAGSTVKPNI